VIADKGKFIITVLLFASCMVMIGFSPLTDVREWAKGLSLILVGYVFANGKQLVAPFVPTPMIVPTPRKAAELAAKVAAEHQELEHQELEHAAGEP
jgi:hypothetical protein